MEFNAEVSPGFEKWVLQTLSLEEKFQDEELELENNNLR